MVLASSPQAVGANAARIIELLGDDDSEVREAAVKALLTAPEVVERHLEPVSALLNHETEKNKVTNVIYDMCRHLKTVMWRHPLRCRPRRED